MLTAFVPLSQLKCEVRDLIPESRISVNKAAPVWDNVDVKHIRRLYSHLCLQHPEAGFRYWRTRGWGLLIWQPVYLSVIAAHRCGIALPLRDIGQHYPVSGVPDGIVFKNSQFKSSSVDNSILEVANEVIAGCHRVYSQWCVPGALTGKSADRVVAECVLSALLWMYPKQFWWRPETVMNIGHHWLDALGLRGAAGFIRYTDASGNTCLALDKKSCCFKYLCREKAPCDICPRLTLSEKLNRLSSA